MWKLIFVCPWLMLHSAAAVVRAGSGGKFQARQLQRTLYFSPSARTATTPCWNATNDCLMFWSMSFIPLNMYKCYSKAGTYTQRTRVHAQHTLLLIHKSTRRVLMNTDWMRATLRCHSPHSMWPIRSRLLFIPSALCFRVSVVSLTAQLDSFFFFLQQQWSEVCWHYKQG